MLSRRSFLVSAGMGIAAGAMMSRAAFAGGGKVPLGIQLWTVKDEAEKDLEGTLRKVYAAGFREIEFAGYYGKAPAELAKFMRDIGFGKNQRAGFIVGQQGMVLRSVDGGQTWAQVLPKGELGVGRML